MGKNSKFYEAMIKLIFEKPENIVCDRSKIADEAYYAVKI